MIRMIATLLLLLSAIAKGDAPELLLANRYHDSIDLSAYWVSEKLDGVRAYWDGQQLLSRQGNPIHAPAWFTRGLPATPLDGELWAGRQGFAAVISAIRQHPPQSAAWRSIGYWVFDLPAAEGPFSQRLQRLSQLVSAANLPQLQLVAQQRIASTAALQAELDRVVAGGGEGLMLHRGDSPYRAGRSDDLLKLKRYQDAEARVIAHLPGQGKYQGMLGALLVEDEQGRRFRLGSGLSDQQRRQPPVIGSEVTYRHFGTTANGLPRFASFLRQRQRP